MPTVTIQISDRTQALIEEKWARQKRRAKRGEETDLSKDEWLEDLLDFALSG